MYTGLTWVVLAVFPLPPALHGACRVLLVTKQTLPIYVTLPLQNGLAPEQLLLQLALTETRPSGLLWREWSISSKHVSGETVIRPLTDAIPSTIQGRRRRIPGKRPSLHSVRKATSTLQLHSLHMPVTRGSQQTPSIDGWRFFSLHLPMVAAPATTWIDKLLVDHERRIPTRLL